MALKALFVSVIWVGGISLASFQGGLPTVRETRSNHPSELVYLSQNSIAQLSFDRDTGAAEKGVASAILLASETGSAGQTPSPEALPLDLTFLKPADLTTPTPSPSIPSPGTTPRRIEATVIAPYRESAVAAEVGGIIEEIRFRPGDFVEAKEVVAEISTRRHELAAEKLRERVRALETA
ncbi:hypothetical protein ACFL2Q_01785, partial [Thermodesulfobacteriota bacterium]